MQIDQAQRILERLIAAAEYDMSKALIADARTALHAYSVALDVANTVVAASIQLVGGFQVTDHRGMYVVERAAYEALLRTLEPYRVATDAPPNELRT